MNKEEDQNSEEKSDEEDSNEFFHTESEDSGDNVEDAKTLFTKKPKRDSVSSSTTAPNSESVGSSSNSSGSSNSGEVEEDKSETFVPAESPMPVSSVDPVPVPILVTPPSDIPSAPRAQAVTPKDATPPKPSETELRRMRKSNYVAGDCYSEEYDNYGSYLYFDYYSRISEDLGPYRSKYCP